MNIKLVYLSAFVVLILGCSSYANQTQNQPGSNALEALHGITLNKNILILNVRSTGCTTADDFVIHLTPLNSEVQLLVERIEEDRCRRMPKVMRIEKVLDYSGIAPNLPIMLLNPLKVSRQ